MLHFERPEVFTYTRVPMLHDNIYATMNILALLKMRGTNKFTRDKVNAEIIRRLEVLVRGLVPRETEQSLMTEMRESCSVFGGWEALKVIKPTAGNNPTHSVYLIFTPRGNFTRTVKFFQKIGFVRMPLDVSTPGMDTYAYRDSVGQTMSLRSGVTGAVLDLVESANQVACFPMFRLSNTYVMQCVSPDAVFSPFVNHSCQLNGFGIPNPFHARGRFRLLLPDAMELEMEVYRALRGVTIERNPAHCFPHDGKCGRDSNCLHTVRSSASEGVLFYRFRGAGNKVFFGDDGVTWRLGGWPCYRGDRGTEPVLFQTPRLHVPYHDEDMLEDVLKLPPYSIFKQVLGWDVVAEKTDD